MKYEYPFVKDPYDQATIKYTCSLHVSMLFLISATQDSFSHTAIKIEITSDILEG